MGCGGSKETKGDGPQEYGSAAGPMPNQQPSANNSRPSTARLPGLSRNNSNRPPSNSSYSRLFSRQSRSHRRHGITISDHHSLEDDSTRHNVVALGTLIDQHAENFGSNYTPSFVRRSIDTGRYAQLVGEQKSDISARPASKQHDADETGVDEEPDLDFFDRECVVLAKGSYTTASVIARMDSGSDIPCCVSMRWLKEHGRVSEMDTKFEHPRVKTLGGSELSIQGVVRDMQFRLKGSNKTFRRDFFVSEALDDWYDFVLGKDFMKKNFDMLFRPGGKVQKMIGGLFGSNRQSSIEKAEEAFLKAKQEIDAKKREADRLARKEKERIEAEEAQKLQTQRST